MNRVAVIGLGRSGQGAALLALRNGDQVYGFDDNPKANVPDGCIPKLGPFEPESLAAFDQLILSPGMPLDDTRLCKAKEAGVEIIGELAFAASHISVPLVAITGTNGKSTTTALIAHVLQEVWCTFIQY